MPDRRGAWHATCVTFRTAVEDSPTCPCFVRSRYKWSNLFWHNALPDQAPLMAGLWLPHWQNRWMK